MNILKVCGVNINRTPSKADSAISRNDKVKSSTTSEGRNKSFITCFSKIKDPEIIRSNQWKCLYMKMQAGFDHCTARIIGSANLNTKHMHIRTNNSITSNTSVVSSYKQYKMTPDDMEDP
eukprot:5514118-Ditylum_brightwellii.AAC.1